MHHPMKLLCSFLLALGLVGCGGGSSSPVVEETIAVIPPDTSGLVLKMENASPTKSLDFYLLPDSDDYESIPQDLMNPITADKVAVGKLIYHDPAFATEGIALRAKTWSCASCHHARAGFKSGLIQGMGEGGEGFGVKGETRAWHNPEIGTQDADVQPVTSPTVLNVAYQDVMLWNGALGNSSNGIINVGIDPDRLMTEGTPKKANEGLSGIETQAIAEQVFIAFWGFPLNWKRLITTRCYWTRSQSSHVMNLVSPLQEQSPHSREPSSLTNLPFRCGYVVMSLR